MSRLRREFDAFLLAAQFLTRLPVPARWSAETAAAAPRWHALIGAGVGALCGGTLWLTAPLLGAPAGALLAIAVGMLATGALHEDGLADLADGLGGGRTRERALDIMRDSRIGAFGALALVLVVGLKAALLVDLGPSSGSLVLVLAHAGGRASAVFATAGARYARAEGAASSIAAGPSAATLLVAAATTAAAALLLPPPAAAAALTALTFSHFALRALYQRRLGGYTGDCLGAQIQIGGLSTCLAAAAVL